MIEMRSLLIVCNHVLSKKKADPIARHPAKLGIIYTTQSGGKAAFWVSSVTAAAQCLCRPITSTQPWREREDGECVNQLQQQQQHALCCVELTERH